MNIGKPYPTHTKISYVKSDQVVGASRNDSRWMVGDGINKPMEIANCIFEVGVEVDVGMVQGILKPLMQP